MAYYLVLRGPLGIGKSTVSRRLAERLAARHISIDRILEDKGLEEWDEDRISLRSFLRANAVVELAARTELEKGRSVVVDGCFYWQEQIDDLLRRLPWPHYVFTLEAPVETCIARDRTRPLPRPGVGPQGGDQMGAMGALAVYRLVRALQVGIPIDASGTLEDTLALIMRHLPT